MSMLVNAAAIVMALLGAGSAVQTPAPSPLSPLSPLSNEQRREFERWWDQQPTISMPFEHDGAKVLIVEFTDLQCPHCRQKYLEIKPILERSAGRPKDVKFLLKHWPISSACNPRVSSNPHPAACDAAAAVVMARRTGTADRLVDWLFLHQDELSPAAVRRAAAEVGQIRDFDAQYARAIQEVKTDAALGSSLGVASTPSFFLNGRRMPGGGVAPQYFGALIDLEITRAK